MFLDQGYINLFPIKNLRVQVSCALFQPGKFQLLRTGMFINCLLIQNSTEPMIWSAFNFLEESLISMLP